jgi:predicted HTH domain antitoxin
VLACQQPSPDKSGFCENHPEPGHPVVSSLSSAMAVCAKKDKSLNRITRSSRACKSHHPVGADSSGEGQSSELTYHRYPEESTMTQLTLQIPESAFAALHQAPDEFGQEMRIAAAVKWYELRRVSQGRATEIAGLTRAAFIDALSRYR